MKRSTSSAFSTSLGHHHHHSYDGSAPPQIFMAETPHDLLQGYKFMSKELQRLTHQVNDMRKQVRGVAEESSMWTLKYSRRVVMVSNSLLAVYILGKRGMDIVNNMNSRSMLIGLIFNPFNWFQKPTLSKRMYGKQGKQEPQLKIMLIQLLWKQLAMSGCLLFSSYWLMSRDQLKRNASIVVTLALNIYLAVTTDVSPWTIYFNCFTLLMYITARYVKNKPILNTIKNNIQRTLSISAITEEEENGSFFNFLLRNKQIKSMEDDTMWSDCKIQPEMIAESPTIKAKPL